MIKVAVGILTNDSRLLLCQRTKSSRYPLKWEFPGGKIEPGETPDQGLKRELHEELSIDAEIGELFDQQHSFYPDSGAYDVYYYMVPSFSGRMINRVFETTAWVTPGDIAGYDILEGNREIVQKLIRHWGYGAKT
jgi:8-oxo-dGTP diphosphatase